jgi:hypothetical protein
MAANAIRDYIVNDVMENGSEIDTIEVIVSPIDESSWDVQYRDSRETVTTIVDLGEDGSLSHRDLYFQ